MVRVLGLTGGSGVGKGTVAQILSVCDGQFSAPSAPQNEHITHGLRFAHIDADAVYRDLLAHNADLLSALCAVFGAEIAENGQLNRTKLAQIVFSDPRQLVRLNEITAPFIRQAVGERTAELSALGAQWVIYDAPTLLQSGTQDLCDCTLAVLASGDIRLQRIMARDGIDAQAARVRIDAQPEDKFYHQNCDFILYNNGDLTKLHFEITRFLEELRTQFPECFT